MLKHIECKCLFSFPNEVSLAQNDQQKSSRMAPAYPRSQKTMVQNEIKANNAGVFLDVFMFSSPKDG